MPEPLSADAGQTGVTTTAASPSAVSDGKTTASSPADGNAKAGVETPSFVDTVRAALDKGQPEKAPISEKPGEETSSSEPVAEGGDDPTDEDIKQLSDKAQKRFRYLSGRVRETEAQVADLQPKAQKLETILSYMEKNRIEPAEFDNSLEITRLIKAGDYQKALEVLTPIYRELANRAGMILPPELQERVRLGYLTEQDARQLHKAQVNERNTRTMTEEQQQRANAERQAEEVNRTVTASVQAADDWAKKKAGSDPDWHLKADLVAEQVELETTRLQNARDPNWFPKTAQEVVKRAEAALKVVEARLKAVNPRPRAISVSTGQPASPRSESAPKSYMDAVNRALGRSG